MEDIHLLSEEDIKLRYITPAITRKGWSVNDISMEAKVKLTDGKINQTLSEMQNMLAVTIESDIIG